MRLIHEDTGKDVQVGDTVTSFRGETATVIAFDPPHKPSASGRVTTTLGHHYVGVYDLVWVDRGDR